MRKLSKHRPSASQKIRSNKNRWMLMEALEQRQLLSVTIVNAKTATFTDIDGDLVTVAVSKGTLTTGLFTTAASGFGEQLQQLDISTAGFAGSTLTISVKQTGTGDGLTNVGYIKATGNSLGKVTVAGDLGRIDAGGAGTGITSLTAFSLGRQGTASQQTGGNLISTITSVGAIAVTTDINQAFLNVAGKIGSIKVGGSLIGGTAANSGSIQSSGGSIGTVFVGQNLSGSTDVGAAAATAAGSIKAPTGSIGNVTVVGSLLGGSAQDSAEILANDKLGKVFIGGGLVGGGGDFSAEVEADTILSVTVNGSITGGGGEGSGSFLASSMGNVFVGGSLIGGAGSDSGAILASDGNLGKVVVMQNLIGGDSSVADPSFTGYIEATGKITSVFVGGNVVAGTTSGGGVLESGSIRAGTTIGAVQINGNLIGNDTLNAVIAARGVSSAKGGVAIGSIFIGGRVDHGQILAGYSSDPITAALTAANGGAKIGKITVDGDWIASTVMAGTAVGTDTLPGTSDDILIPGLGTGTGAIASITIFGQIFGTAGGGDHFGFISSSIGSFSAAGTKALLTKAKDSLLIGGTVDVSILEK